MGRRKSSTAPWATSSQSESTRLVCYCRFRHFRAVFFRKKDARCKLILTAMLRCSGTFYSPGSMIMEMDFCGFKMKLLLIGKEFLGEFWDNCFQAVPSHYMMKFPRQLVHQTTLRFLSLGTPEVWSLSRKATNDRGIEGHHSHCSNTTGNDSPSNAELHIATTAVHRSGR